MGYTAIILLPRLCGRRVFASIYMPDFMPEKRDGRWESAARAIAGVHQHHERAIKKERRKAQQMPLRCSK
jgi:hypothetical protein